MIYFKLLCSNCSGTDPPIFREFIFEDNILACTKCNNMVEVVETKIEGYTELKAIPNGRDTSTN